MFLIVIGTRPEIIKAMPVINKMNTKNIPYKLIWSGQHKDYEMSKVFYDELNIPKPDVYLNIGDSEDIADKLGYMILEIKKILDHEKPEALYGVGDTTTTLATALIAGYSNIPFIHDESGMRSFDLTMLEEINRILVDRLAYIHFAPTKLAVLNLLSEGVPSTSIKLVGSTAVDSLLQILNSSKIKQAEESIHALINLNKRTELATLTLHRRENLSCDKLSKLISILDLVGRSFPDLKIVFPVHPHTNKRLQECGFLNQLTNLPNVIILRPLGYIKFIALIKASSLVITDSGGIQEEAFILGKKIITLRKITEWPETIILGYNKLIDLNERNAIPKIIYEINVALNEKMKPPELKNFPIGDGKASERIIRVLKEFESPKIKYNLSSDSFDIPYIISKISINQKNLCEFCLNLDNGIPRIILREKGKNFICIEKSLTDLRDIKGIDLYVNWDLIDNLNNNR
ncbi:MAG: UDP-N-acetylglucosamine 2-epimerase (non-hydrolyzing) [Nitrososphaeria archaeon]